MPTSRDELDKDLLDLVEKGLLQMAYDKEKDDWVFWLTTEGATLGAALEAQEENDESARNH